MYRGKYNVRYVKIFGKVTLRSTTLSLYLKRILVFKFLHFIQGFLVKLLQFLPDPFLLLNNQNKTKRELYHVLNLVLLEASLLPHHFELRKLLN